MRNVALLPGVGYPELHDLPRPQHDNTCTAGGAGSDDAVPHDGMGQSVQRRSLQAVILSPFAVILSEAKNLALPLRVNSAKDLAQVRSG